MKEPPTSPRKGEIDRLERHSAWEPFRVRIVDRGAFEASNE
jgi:hypothetical protein